MQKSFILSQLYAFITVSLWSTAYIFTKVALEHFTASALGLIRCFIASLCLVVVVLAKRPGLPAREYLPWFIASGVTGFSVYMIAFNTGASMLGATTSCVIISTSPIITALFASAIFGERLRPLQWLAIAVAFAGVVIMSLWDGIFSVGGGLAWMLAAAVLVSMYNILQRKLSRRFSALEITAYSFVPGTLFLMIFAPAAIGEIQTAPGSQIALVVFLGIFPSALAYLSWGKALTVAPKTSSVTNYMFLTPFLALVMEYAVTGVLPGIGTFIGGGVILSGLLVFTLAKGK